MDLRDGVAGNRVQVRPRIETVVHRVDVDVVDVEEELAAAAPGDCGHEVPFGHRVGLEAQIRRDVLDEKRPPEGGLHRVDAIAHQREGLVGEGQRQQVVEVTAIDATPAQVLGYGRGLDAGDEPLQAREVYGVERVG